MISENEVVGTTNVLQKNKEYSSYDDDHLKKAGNDAIKCNKPPLFELIADDSLSDDHDFQKFFCGGDYIHDVNGRQNDLQRDNDIISEQ